MKKYIALILILTFAVLSCSCGNQKLPPEETVVAEAMLVSAEMPVIEQTAEPEVAEQGVQEEQGQTAIEEVLTEVTGSGGCTVEANGYTVTVDSVQQATDYIGNPVIFVNCTFSNNGSPDAAFGDIIEVTASQNGSRLVGDGPNLILDASVLLPIRQQVGSGQSIAITCPFSTADFSSLVDISVNICENSVARPVLGNGSCTMPIN